MVDIVGCHCLSCIFDYLPIEQIFVMDIRKIIEMLLRQHMVVSQGWVFYSGHMFYTPIG